MSFFLRDRWLDWARDWGLTHVPQRGLLRRTEQVVGERNGLLFRAGWGSEQYPGLTVVVRFPQTVDVQRLRQVLIDDATLDALPAKGRARRNMAVAAAQARASVRWGKPPEFSLGDNALTWRRVFPWVSPNVAKVQAWVDALVSAVARATPVFDRHCEVCHVASVARFVLVDDLPVYMCAGCQQRSDAEGDLAERAYEQTEPNHGVGAGLAGFAAIVGAVGWAAVSALTQREFAAAAIGIGALIAWAYRLGAERVDTIGRGIAAGLTLFSVSLGELLLFAWWVAKARPDIGFRIEAGWFVYLDSWRTHPGEQVFTLVLAGVGAWVAFQALQRPKLKHTIRQADDSASQGRRAA